MLVETDAQGYPNHILSNQLFINNEFVDAKSGTRLKVYNPVNDELISEDIHSAGPEDVDAAVLSARKALKGEWSRFSGAQRAACMLKFAELVERNAERLAYTEALPTGRPVSMLLEFDIPHMAAVFRYYAGWADKIAGKSFKAENGSFKIVQYAPIGVCTGLASFNATHAYIGWKIAPALAAGCTFIFKPSEKSPFGVLSLGPLFVEAGFPPGVVTFLNGAGETGALLASHMGIDSISFTGSINGGKAVQVAAAKSNLKKTTLELGGKSAAIVFDDASLDVAINNVGGGFLANSGQICAASSRVLVQESIAEKFLAGVRTIFEDAARNLGNNPLEKTTAHGPVVDKSQFERIMSYITIGKRDATLVAGGNRKGTKGCFIEPTLFSEPALDSKVWQEEIFGPVLNVKTFKTEEEAIELANNTPYGLSATVYTSNVARALRISTALESGTVAVNSPFIPDINTPFGGTKQSGHGRELGMEGLFEYLEPKSIHISMAG